MRRAQTLDEFISRYKFTKFPVRIYYDTGFFQSADHYSGTYVVTKRSLFRAPVWTLSSEVGHDLSEDSNELPETKFAKEVKDEIGKLTEEEHEEMSGWLEDYLRTDLKEKMKHKATEVREKRTCRTLQGKSKVEFHKTLHVNSEVENLETDDALLSKVLLRKREAL